jgi:hypothetical protein
VSIIDKYRIGPDDALDVALEIALEIALEVALIL